MSNSIWVIHCQHCSQSFTIPRNILLSLGNFATCPHCSNSNSTQTAVLTPESQVSTLMTVTEPKGSSTPGSHSLKTESVIERKITPKKAPLPTSNTQVHNEASSVSSSTVAYESSSSKTAAVPIRKIAPKIVGTPPPSNNTEPTDPSSNINVQELFKNDQHQNDPDPQDVKERLAQKLKQAALERTTQQLQQQGIELVHDLPQWTQYNPKPLWFYPAIFLQLVCLLFFIFLITPQTFLRYPPVYQLANMLCTNIGCQVPSLIDPLALRLSESRFEMQTPESLKFDFSIENLTVANVRIPKIKVIFFDAQGHSIETVIIPTSLFSPTDIILPKQQNNYVLYLKAPVDQIDNFKVTFED